MSTAATPSTESARQNVKFSRNLLFDSSQIKLFQTVFDFDDVYTFFLGFEI